ncbi:MAG TPA: MerR family transcriptional regulator [Pirellulales bacterium]|nr:MerR family transcriptional regulator [Pirellulales bacterium]
MEPRWKITELADVVRQVLAGVGNVEQPSARVCDVPDLRTIRYYTTLGIVDRPVEMRGRTAFYAWRHVWQLLAIKQLQAGGSSLVEVQQRLAGADDRMLKRLAGVPGRLALDAAAGTPRITAARQPARPARATFWADSPATADAAAPLAGETSVLRPALHIELGQGITLVLEDVEPGDVNRDKLAAIERAARGLTKPRRHLASPAPVDAVAPQSSATVRANGPSSGTARRAGGAERSRS